MVQRTLLLCGFASSLVYAAINVAVPLTWPAYSVVDQTVSELSAIGSPTRKLWMVVVVPYLVLFAAFGWGVASTAGESRWLRLTGWLILLYGAFNAYWPPMHRREVLAAGGGTLTDTLHLVWAGVTVFLFVLIMAFGAAGLGRRFRSYTVASAAVLLACGLLTSLQASNVGADLPTPWIGVWERINIGVFLAWVAVFSVLLLRRQASTISSGRQ